MKTIQKKLLFILFILPLSLFAQSSLKGTVLDNLGQTLPGVNILVKGTQNGAATDFDGNFTINNLNKGDILVFTYVGFETQELVYNNQNQVSITLKEDAQQLADVVVIGYGTTTKKDATGSLIAVTEKDFNKGSIVSADQLLTGKASGVRITNNGGQPDSAPNIRIRGGSSISANNNPLIVIDGIAIDNTNPAGVSNPLTLINPNDIESFTILKDASATAIYGSRASNGVIIITTKKGSSGSPEFNFSSSVGVGKVGKKINVMDGNEFSQFIRQYHPTLSNKLGVDSGIADDPNTEVDESRKIYNTDWQEAIYRTSIVSDNNFSARANLLDKIPFRASIGYTRNEGLLKTNDYERYSASFKLTPKLFNDHLKIDVNAKGISSEKNAVDEGGAIGGAINMDPTKPIYSDALNNRFGGYYQNTVLRDNRYIIDGQSNPLALLEQRNRPERAQRLLANIELDYKMHFLPELRAVLNLGVDASESKIREDYTSNAIQTYRFIEGNTDPNNNFVFNPGTNYGEFQTKTNTTLEGYLQYTKNLNGIISKFDVQGGYSYQNFKNDGTKDFYQYNQTTGIRELVINENNPTNRYYNLLNLQSFFGRANIDFVNKYLVTLSLRADGSSLYSKENRWGYFPAAALAWKIKEENFVKNIDIINDLKLRLSYGETGQQDITGLAGFYPSTPLFEIGNNNSQYLPGVNLYSPKAFNPDLTWEKTSTTNLGIDFDFFKNSVISGSFDIFQRKTNDLLAKVPLPPGQGLSDSFVKNVGSTESKGFELNLNSNVIDNDNFQFSVNSNIAYAYAKVSDLQGISQIPTGDSGLPIQTNVQLARHAVGFQPRSAWVFEQLYDSNGQPIVGAYVDRNGDNTITNEDRYYKALTPNWTYGFGLNFNYKNWDLSSSFRGQLGGQVYNAAKVALGWIDKAIPVNTSSLSNVLNFYEGAADPNFENIQGNIPLSDYYLEDATFLRCENIVLGYAFNNFSKNASLRIYGALNNAFILTKYSGQDPENFNGIDSNFYPRPKIYTLGVNLNF